MLGCAIFFTIAIHGLNIAFLGFCQSGIQITAASFQHLLVFFFIHRSSAETGVLIQRGSSWSISLGTRKKVLSI